MKKVITFIVVMFLLNVNVSAASLCSYQEQSELNSKAANIKASYEIIKEITDNNDDAYSDSVLIEDFLKVSISNVSEEFYVLVKNDYNREQKTYTTKSAKDGIITFDWKNTDEVTNFTIQVYTTNKVKCPDERIKTIYLTVPRYNKFSNRDICLENKDFYLCQEYVTFAEINNVKFTEQMVKYLNKEVDNKGEVNEDPTPSTPTDVIFNFINTYKWYIIIVILAGVFAGVSIYKVKTKKQRELGL